MYSWNKHGLELAMEVVFKILEQLKEVNVDRKEREPKTESILSVRTYGHRGT